MILLSKHINNVDPTFRWTAELEGEENIKASRPTWQEAQKALIAILIQLSRIEVVEQCQWMMKTYPVPHQYMHPDSELRDYVNKTLVSGDLVLTSIRNDGIERCPICRERIAELTKQKTKGKKAFG